MYVQEGLRKYVNKLATDILKQKEFADLRKELLKARAYKKFIKNFCENNVRIYLSCKTALTVESVVNTWKACNQQATPQDQLLNAFQFSKTDEGSTYWYKFYTKLWKKYQ